MAWCSVANHFKRIHCIACITVYYVVLAEFKTRIGIPAGNAWVLLIFCKEGEKCSNHCMWSPNFLHTTARNWIQTWFHASLIQAGMKRRLEFDFGALSCLRITSIADFKRIHCIVMHYSLLCCLSFFIIFFIMYKMLYHLIWYVILYFFPLSCHSVSWLDELMKLSVFNLCCCYLLVIVVYLSRKEFLMHKHWLMC